MSELVLLQDGRLLTFGTGWFGRLGNGAGAPRLAVVVCGLNMGAREERDNEYVPQLAWDPRRFRRSDSTMEIHGMDMGQKAVACAGLKSQYLALNLGIKLDKFWMILDLVSTALSNWISL